LKPILNTKDGSLLVDGVRYLAPKVSVPMEHTNIFGLNFLPPVEPEYVPELPVACKCHPRCKAALKPRCECGCGGRGHSEALRQQYHTLEEFNGAIKAPPLGVYL